MQSLLSRGLNALKAACKSFLPAAPVPVPAPVKAEPKQKFIHLLGDFTNTELIVDGHVPVVKDSTNICDHRSITVGKTTYVLWNNPSQDLMDIMLVTPEGKARSNFSFMGDMNSATLTLRDGSMDKTSPIEEAQPARKSVYKPRSLPVHNEAGSPDLSKNFARRANRTDFGNLDPADSAPAPLSAAENNHSTLLENIRNATKAMCEHGDKMRAHFNMMKNATDTGAVIQPLTPTAQVLRFG